METTNYKNHDTPNNSPYRFAAIKKINYEKSKMNELLNRSTSCVGMVKINTEIGLQKTTK